MNYFNKFHFAPVPFPLGGVISRADAKIFFIRHHEWITTYQIKAVTLRKSSGEFTAIGSAFKDFSSFFFAALVPAAGKKFNYPFNESFKQLWNYFLHPPKQGWKTSASGELIEKRFSSNICVKFEEKKSQVATQFDWTDLEKAISKARNA